MVFELDKRSIAVCIPTFKRTQLLERLLHDLFQQTLQPALFTVVDGDPDSGDVLALLGGLTFPESSAAIYVPANHANLAYQRYVGWRIAADQRADVLVYFDDDQRIYQRDVLEWLTKPLEDQQGDVVGVGCYSRTPENIYDPETAHLATKRPPHWLVRRYGSKKALGLNPGQLTPVGHRIGLVDGGQDYVETDWLQGRVMTYRMAAISQETFSSNLFALTHVHCGLGEDTFLSRRVGARGRLLYTFRAVVDHPDADTPKAYPYEAYRYAYAATYSRRFLNDTYRVYEPPTRSDRWALVKSYAGNILLSWMQVARKPTNTNFALARGTTLGAIHGLTRPPTAKRLTPEIDWWADAEQALSQQHSLRARLYAS